MAGRKNTNNSVLEKEMKIFVTLLADLSKYLGFLDYNRRSQTAARQRYFEAPIAKFR
jgi:hypothetical protein